MPGTDSGPDSYFRIRSMRRADANLALDWAAAEGWNPGLYDAAPFLATDPDAFLIGLLDGSPIACISAVAYSGAYGFIGFRSGRSSQTMQPAPDACC